MAYAQALVDWGDVGGYELETLWDECTMAALGCLSRRPSGARSLPSPAVSRSGSSSKRCCAARRRCSSSTSRTTISTCPASAGSRRPHRVAQDGALHQPRPRAVVAGRHPHRHPGTQSGGRHDLGAPGILHDLCQARQRAQRTARGAAAPLGRGARRSSRASCRCIRSRRPTTTDIASRYQAAETRLRSSSRPGRPSGAVAAERAYAADRGPHRPSAPSWPSAWNCSITGAADGGTAHPADATLRRRAVVRRAHRRARLEWLRQIALPAAARRRRQ
jgi:hypothetical protein